MRNSIITLLGLVFLVQLGQCKKKSDTFKLTSIQLEYTTNYDDNILRYSERDIGQFEEGTEYYPSRLSTYDDWKNDFRLKLYINGPRLIRKPLKIRYFGKFSGYYRNPFNNYTTHTLLFYQEITRRLEADFMYFYMPGYYLREYRDRDLNEYHSCEFDDHQVRLGFSYRLYNGWEASFQTEYEQIYYNGYFTEYDSEILFYDFGMRKWLGKDWRIDANYGFMISDNIGYSLTQITAIDPLLGEDTEYGDSSYEEDVFVLQVSYTIRNLLNKELDLSLQYKLRKRYYTTDNSLEKDPFHAGRADDRQRIIFDLSRELSPKFSVTLSYTREWREVESGNQTVIDIKEFEQNVFSLGLNYKLK